MRGTSGRVLLALVGTVTLAIVAIAMNSQHGGPPSFASGPVARGPITATPTLQIRTVLLSKEDADSGQRLGGWELIAYRGAGCQGHPVNDAFTQTEPVALQLGAGQYSFLETMQAGWTNVTPLCQNVDLSSSDGALVFRNRHQATPGSLPDLVLDSIADAQQPFDCVRPAGVKVAVRNAGTGDAGPSTTRVSVGGSAQLLPTTALSAGQSVTLYSSVTGIPIGDTYTAEADYNHEITEANEANNLLSQSLSLSTLPTCTSTPLGSVTPIGTPTATPDMNMVRLSKEDADTGERLTGWELIAYRGPSCEGHPINDAFTATQPVAMSLIAGVYSFLETLQPGWVNVTPLCQAVDLSTADADLVFRNRLMVPPGDVNCDGIVTSVDASLVLQLEAALLDVVGCKLQADVNHDGTVNALDALLILQHVAGLIDLGSLS